VHNVDPVPGFRAIRKKSAAAHLFCNRADMLPVSPAKTRRYDVAQPPKATPHSDIDGVHRDEKRNVDSANEAGQDSGDLARAQAQSAARPPYSDDDGRAGAEAEHRSR